MTGKKHKESIPPQQDGLHEAKFAGILASTMWKCNKSGQIIATSHEFSPQMVV